VRCPLRSADFPLTAVQGTVGAKDDGHTGKQREFRGRPADAYLDAAVESVMRAELIYDAGIERCLGGAVGIRTRKPEDFSVRIPSVGHGGAQRRRQQMLGKMRKTMPGPNHADAVIHIDVPARSDIGSRQ